MPREVLHILGSAQPEGSSIARMVGALAQRLDPSRYRLRACFLAGNGPLVATLRSSGVECIALNWWKGARDPAGAWKFWRRLRGLRVDLAHTHFGGRSVRRLAHAATGAKTLFHLHSRVLEPKGLTPATFSARGLDSVVAVSRAVAHCVVDGDARVIYAGAEVNRPPLPRAAGGSKLVVGFAGRLVALKGIDYLLRAAALLKDCPNLRIEIAGSGPERSNLAASADRLELTGRVKFLDWVDDMQSVLDRWDIFALPSLEEGFPVAALEAMAAGLPVIASSAGGIAELVVDAETGWLVPPADVESLASRLRSLLCNPALRKRMGEAGRNRVRNQFSLDSMTQSFAQLYDELVGDHG